ncbi:Cell division cycle protein 27 [Amphibalanus amphitrite]|uniref:Cell division cycle protein 27 homolog n=1 Tax=Amphibalanus amphitrite TaxID=1232801 RepID=A0A6A4VZY5_AMPAM|nr:cell division cycle protein 27 homolog [Amphibalanus amphitrite]KAF0295081.1 Cell division cycle protein 27 [Amphibalanus amphitrite]
MKMIIQEPVQAAIWHCLNHYAYSDATFLAERLCAEVQSDESVHLLATCYYRSGRPGQAHTLLHSRQPRLPAARYLLALCCFELDRLAEAESILSGGSILKPKGHDDVSGEFGDSASLALRLLARIYIRTERKAKAAEACKKSLKLNPFLWSAFVDLCNLGESVDSAKVFTTAGLDSFAMCQGPAGGGPGTEPAPQQHHAPAPHGVGHVTNVNITSTPYQTPVTALGGGALPPGCGLTVSKATPDSEKDAVRGKQALFRSQLNSTVGSPYSPSFGFLPLDTPSPGGESLPLGLLSSSPALTNNAETHDTKPGFGRRVLNRKDRAMLGLSGSSVKENNKANRLVTPKSPSRKIKTRSSKTALTTPNFNELNEKNRSERQLKSEPRGRPGSETITSAADAKPLTGQQLQVAALTIQRGSAEGLMSLLRDVGAAYQQLSQFSCRRAVDLLSALPAHQFDTGWVLSMLGKAHFELNDYKQAVRYFQMVREREPYRLETMEYYSTALWHLQREVELSALAQDLLDHGRHSAEVWCAAGNCFSLQKEHETAIRFFTRAVQVTPQFAYGHTLLGHEYVMTEELEKALTCFRRAVSIDPRHYNAWYGIGMIFYKQERYTMAEMYFKNALDINPQSSVLMCHVGVVQHNLQKTDAALLTLNRAIALDPANPLCKFHRASVFLSSERLQEALDELLQLKQMVPNESLVFFLLGKVHEKMGHAHLARMHFSWAMDLDPKGANNQLKEAIEPAISRGPADDDKTAGEAGVLGDSSFLPADMTATPEAAEPFQPIQAMESDESL